MAIVDRHGLPLAATTHAANHHEVTWVPPRFDFYLSAPHRFNRVRKTTRDGRWLRRHGRRWIVERFFAGIQWQRRLLVRWEYHPAGFLGFVQLADLCILLKRP